MNFYFKIFLLVIILVLPTTSTSQTNLKNERLQVITSLEDRIQENQKLMLTDLEASKANIDLLLNEAVSTNNENAEVLLLANTCRYYFQKEDASGLFKASEILYDKAEKNQNNRMKALSKMYLAESLKFNSLFDDALLELQEALEILEREDSLDFSIINTKSNVYISFANTYSHLNKPKIAVTMMMKGGDEFSKVPEGEYRDYLNYLYHSNLGIYYMEYDPDATEFHARKSISLRPKEMEKDDVIMLRNYLSLGKVYTEKKEFDNAIEFLSKAELLAIEIGEYVNLKDTYETLIDVAKQKNNSENIEEYTNRLQSLKLMQFETKNKSLHQIIEKRKLKQSEIDKQNQRTFYVWILLIVGISVIIIAISIFVYRNKIHSKYERLSKEFLEKNEVLEEDKLAIYNEIIDLVKKDDPAFMISFNNAFPNFIDSLLKINPKLAKGEVEFCALLKLNLTTKQIAQYKVIQPRTVQNKKYQIRKKLNIPNDIDIYNWIHGI
ncbi:helix-turn-helix transcriptional regulator [Aequorivita viscosa]|uniref:Regulatory protein, luxR family n=1 Tax=Aequorivita viscosa TaxID=797419 RepID=A0A1M6M580_9FLAO|nr:LuxR C-terminal-related transcriptional regulator [Aequorivita viscosa]SDX30403.1 regulatory protein, luxR family [Aequorivita viscosa]SHJ78520.1 regulatory protein, luxR family [Aequorivita viscosa]